jgi:hypothetical protein
MATEVMTVGFALHAVCLKTCPEQLGAQGLNLMGAWRADNYAIGTVLFRQALCRDTM